MELHTLGVDGGYTQADVTMLARMLTGWSFDPRRGGDNTFRFFSRLHDEGDKVWLGKSVPVKGIAEGNGRLTSWLPVRRRRATFPINWRNTLSRTIRQPALSTGWRNVSSPPTEISEPFWKRCSRAPNFALPKISEEN